MIITLTPNPSVDRTLQVKRLFFNEILRTDQARLDWGGKGFNVSRALRLLRQESLALAWVGGGAGKMLEDGLNKLGIETDFVWVEEETRTNTIAQEEGGEWYMRLNEPGPHIPETAVRELIDKTTLYAHTGNIWVASGSLPLDVPVDFYARLFKMLQAKGVRVFFDSNGEALKLGLTLKPYLVSPDLAEAEAVVGFSIRNIEDAKKAVLSFLRLGVEHIAISFDQGKLVLASQKEMVTASPLKVPTRNITGSGDALMAGLVYGFSKHHALKETARWANAFRAAWVSNARYEDIREGTVENLFHRAEAISLPMI